jgi:hypothetical protein
MECNVCNPCTHGLTRNSCADCIDSSIPHKTKKKRYQIKTDIRFEPRTLSPNVELVEKAGKFLEQLNGKTIDSICSDELESPSKKCRADSEETSIVDDYEKSVRETMSDKEAAMVLNSFFINN